MSNAPGTTSTSTGRQQTFESRGLRLNWKGNKQPSISLEDVGRGRSAILLSVPDSVTRVNEEGTQVSVRPTRFWVYRAHCAITLNTKDVITGLNDQHSTSTIERTKAKEAMGRINTALEHTLKKIETRDSDFLPKSKDDGPFQTKGLLMRTDIEVDGKNGNWPDFEMAMITNCPTLD